MESYWPETCEAVRCVDERGEPFARAALIFD